MISSGPCFDPPEQALHHVLCTEIDVLEEHRWQFLVRLGFLQWLELGAYLRLKHFEQKLQVNGLCETSKV